MLNKHFLRSANIALCMTTLSVGLVGCGDRFADGYKDEDRELSNNISTDPNLPIVDANPPAPSEPDPGSNNGERSSMSGIWRLTSDDPVVQGFLGASPFAQNNILLAEGAQADYLELFVCGLNEFRRLNPVPGPSRRYQLAESIPGLGRIEIAYGVNGAPVAIVPSPIGGEYNVAMVKGNSQDTFSLIAPQSSQVGDSEAICGKFSQVNQRQSSNVTGEFHYVANDRLHELNVYLSNGLGAPQQANAALYGAWYEALGGDKNRELADPVITVMECGESKLRMQLAGNIAEGAWLMSLYHRGLSPSVTCPAPEVVQDPIEPVDPIQPDDVIQDEVNEVPGDEVIVDVPPEPPVEPEPPIIVPEEPEVPVEEEIEPPVDLLPEEEVDAPPVEDIPAPLPITPPPEPDPLAVGEANCLPVEPNDPASLTGRWQLNAIYAGLLSTYEGLEEAVIEQLSNSLFLLDQQTEVALGVCELADLQLNLVRNGNELYSEALNTLVANQDLVTLESIVVQEDANTILMNVTANLGDTNGTLPVPLLKRPNDQQNVCWDSDALPDFAATADICAAAQEKGLRLVFSVNNQLMAVNFTLPEQPDVATYEISETYPATLVSNLFLETGLEATQIVVEGALVIESVGADDISGRFRLSMPAGEEIIVEFGAHFNPEVVVVPPAVQ